MAFHRPIDAEERAKILAAFVANGGNVRQTSRECGRDEAAVRRICADIKDAARCGSVAVQFPDIEALVQEAAASREPRDTFSPDALLARLKRGGGTLEELATAAKTTKGKVLDWIEEKRKSGSRIELFGERYEIAKETPHGNASGRVFEYVSRLDNTYVFGACGDNHLGSKYARLDVLDSLYDRYREDGVDRVFNAGNWIDGESRFNKYDLAVHGMQAQIDHLIATYPQRDGIETYAIAGDDHEGWYAQREGINIGKHAESMMRQAGRTDWHNLGYMEATVRLVNANSGESSDLMVIHPGGGSAYALSYTSQKIVESLEGGEKPSVLLMGHYHKLWAGNIRNVWVAQTGTTMDQSPFMRKKRLEAHVGGYVITLKQDPRTGAITEFLPNMIRYFNRGYYEQGEHWSHSGPVVQPMRSR